MSAKDKIAVLNLPAFDRKHVDIPFLVNSQAQKLIEYQGLLMFGVSSRNVAKVCVYNYQTNSVQYSKNVHPTEQEKVVPFGLCANIDATTILIGTSVNSQTVHEDSVCLWDRKENKYTFIPLTHQPYKEPSSIQVTPDWSYGLVGWTNGYLAVVDLQNNKEISVYQAHGHAIYNITFLAEGRLFITMSQDHCLKLWNSDRQIKKCLAEYHSQQQTAELSEANGLKLLDEKQESVDIATSDKYIATALSDHSKGPQTWNSEDGTLNGVLTSKLQAIYESSLKNHQPNPDPVTGKTHSLNDPTSGRTHGSVTLMSNDILLYERKRRDFMAIWTFNLQDKNNPAMIAQCATPAFLRTITPRQGGQEQKLLLVKDGELEILTFPEMEKFGCIQIPKITDEIVNIHSGGGKKKLMYYKAAVTIDGKYFVLANPSVGNRQIKPTKDDKNSSLGKFFDLVDLEEKKYHWKVAPIKICSMDFNG